MKLVNDNNKVIYCIIRVAANRLCLNITGVGLDHMAVMYKSRICTHGLNDIKNAIHTGP
jgi:hypothetical protein